MNNVRNLQVGFGREKLMQLSKSTYAVVDETTKRVALDDESHNAPNHVIE